MKNKITLIFILLLSIVSFGEEFRGSYEEGYIEIEVNKKINYSFFPIYMDYSLEEPYVGVMNLFALTMSKGMKLDLEKKIIYGRMGEKDYKFYYGDTKYIRGKEDVYIRGKDLSKVFKLKSYEWNTETYVMKMKTKFKTPYEIYIEQQEKLRGLDSNNNEEIDEKEIYSPKRKLFTLGVLKPRYTNYDLKEENGHFSSSYSNQMLYGDFMTTGFIYPEAYFGYTALKYNEVLNDKSIIIGDANMQTYEFLNSRRLTGIAVQDWNGTGDIEVGQTSIRGFAQYNTTVELYRNGVLYRFTRVGKDGAYVFENIDIQGYSDIYTIKIYNFDGTIEIRQVSMLSGNKILKKNKIDYGFIIGTYREIDEEDSIDIEKKEMEGNIRFSYGIVNNLTLGFDYVNNITVKTLEGKSYNFPTELAGLNLYYTTGAVKFPTYFEFSEIYDVEYDTKNRYTHIGKIRQRLGGNVFSIEGYMYSDFIALLQGYENRYVADWRGSINNYWGYNLSYDYKDEFGFIEEYGSGDIYRNKGDSSHELGIIYPLKDTYGTRKLYYNYSNSNIKVFDTDLNFIFEIKSNFEKFEEETNLKVGLKTAANKTMKAGVYAKYDSQNEYEMGMEVSYKVFNWLEIISSLIHDGDKTDYNVGVDIEKTIILEKPFINNSNPSINKSWMEGRIFMDDNSNGQFDKSEMLLEGVEVNVGRKKGVTGEDGIYFIDNIGSYETKDFNVNIESLDPMLEAANEKTHIKLYPSVGGEVDIPIQQISVIMGNLEFKESEIDGVKHFPIISQLYIQLKTLEGKIVKEQRLELEGFYMLEKVLPGNYILSIDYRGEGKLVFEKQEKKINIKLDKYGSYFEDYNFKIISYEKE